ncbi:MAG: ATP phosphoribosyltransferase regulatory subunit [Moraxellaceae bacterium]|jgi:ATP phosphoribosyltransferase regulatory subunit|nr:ATP phosphoribosyltransferase regulatory subunit [Moraxellaceae bacterium]MBP7229146.1 ATP phosphoribosyltransferase regulatory subunit [Moraxellaceae bacterium]MBP9730520.1 ATP phosphoribosyltransferase regulatory subunit [Moraxellaceae bacterium]MCC6201020.1 ATP phosphoribosyltransferase regulatory subunit [Moraxellaceae bacterium]HQX90665.1 ATP phosphoribosyltransferase regulatory subunit [Moraxellaceae bacterium]
MTRSVDTWLLPDGVADVLPAEAARLEQLRRRLLDTYAAWGYQLVIPPLMEHLESLLTGSGHDIELMTFKITDQLSGRMMGVRADITPQVARLDAHVIPVEGPARYCYAGTTLNTRPASLAASRCPVQIGAELYGYAGVAGDIEILRLMLDTLATAGCRDIYLDLGHVALFRELAAAAGIAGRDEDTLFDIYQRKAAAELREFLDKRALPAAMTARFDGLLRLAGDADVLTRARELLSGVSASADTALNTLDCMVAALAVSHPSIKLYIDLTELRGYHYHTGLVFAAYAPGTRAELAKGGRYDHVGEAFGRARAATGFSADLKALLAFGNGSALRKAILAPAGDDVALRAAIADLRMKGEHVVQQLPGDNTTAASLDCERVLVERNGQWTVTNS